MIHGKILLIEDDLDLGKTLKKLLEHEGYQVTWHPNLTLARSEVDGNYHLVILDWMLPDGQGVDFLRELRNFHPLLPVIFLTARADLIDKILGLESGANDYLTKPFEMRELIARIRVQLRIGRPTPLTSTIENTKIVIEQLEILLLSRQVFFQGKEIELTKMEFELLKLLAQFPGRVFSREELLNKVWGYENYPTTRTVDTHVLQLRQKICDGLIQTKRGIGYYLHLEIPS